SLIVCDHYLVVNTQEPDIVDNAFNEQIGRRVQVCRAAIWGATPFFKFLMCKRDGVDAKLFKERVGRSSNPVGIKFFFEQFVYCGIERKRKPRHTGDAETTV